jgi:hypothetical protein
MHTLRTSTESVNQNCNWGRSVVSGSWWDEALRLFVLTVVWTLGLW